MKWFFGFFVFSGFCSILYEVIWLRSAMAQFGVTTAIVSLVLSSFMIGLGVGSYGSGYLVRKYETRLPFPVLRLYAVTELLIGISATAVPLQLYWGRELLLRVREMSFSSVAYYVPAGLWIALTFVPWCACMGATFPFAMAAIRQYAGADAQRSFSYLYVANVLGAVSGATVPLFLIELLGFHRTLLAGAALNLLLAICAFALTLGKPKAHSPAAAEPAPPSDAAARTLGDRKLLWLLFGTGVTSMGAEVVWVRLYTPSLGTFVYAFAAILAIYLVGTYSGSWVYRRKPRTGTLENGMLWLVFGILVLLAFLTADPRIRLPGVLRVVVGIMPFAALAGFVTPMILDRYSAGDPDRAGSAYAVNIAGCVLGPLIAGFLLLPALGERLSLCLFALPWLIAGLSLLRGLPFRGVLRPSSALAMALVLASLVLILGAKGYEQQFRPRRVLRDSTATVVATGSGMGKRLLVNGVGMTTLTPITKMMAHLPLAFLDHPPQRALVICFGMGTSELAMLSWGVQATAVELVPSVPRLVTFFHPRAESVLQSPLARIVIDDGRSYLERPSELYDVIIIDPPPPVEAAGSSLLYSKEFYATARQHLRPDGILAQWLPDGGDPATTVAIAKSIAESFPYVRTFNSVQGWGIHFLASVKPLPQLSAEELARRLPPAAARNLIEWGPASTPSEQFARVVNHEISLASILQRDPSASALQDDHPVNEYFLLRRLRDPAFEKTMWEFVSGRQNSPAAAVAK